VQAPLHYACAHIEGLQGDRASGFGCRCGWPGDADTGCGTTQPQARRTMWPPTCMILAYSWSCAVAAADALAGLPVRNGFHNKGILAAVLQAHGSVATSQWCSSCVATASSRFLPGQQRYVSDNSKAACPARSSYTRLKGVGPRTGRVSCAVASARARICVQLGHPGVLVSLGAHPGAYPTVKQRQAWCTELHQHRLHAPMAAIRKHTRSSCGGCSRLTDLLCRLRRVLAAAEA
jgi:hypothetical protein